MKMAFLLMTSLLMNVLPMRAVADDFRVISSESFVLADSPYEGLTKMRFSHRGEEDHAIIDRSDSRTWVVFFHSFGGDALEIFQSPLIHPQWINAIKAEGYGLVSFQTYGNSWMSPRTADAVHRVLEVIRQDYGVERFIFIGGSMGGSAVLIYCVRYPEDVFAALAMCPVSEMESHYAKSVENPDSSFYMRRWPIERYYGESETEQKESFAINSVQRNVHRLTMPLVIAHGDADRMIPVSQSDELAHLLKDKRDFRYIRYENGDHFLPSVQGFKEAWPWLMEQIK